jgi:hypothetical protein
MKIEKQGISRRDFAKAAAMSAAVVVVPSDLLAQDQNPAPEAAKGESSPSTTKLSPASQAEADLSYETILRKYGSRFSEDQKKEIRRLVNQQQSGLDKLRAFPIGNSVEPANVFKPLVQEGHR